MGSATRTRARASLTMSVPPGRVSGGGCGALVSHRRREGVQGPDFAVDVADLDQALLEAVNDLQGIVLTDVAEVADAEYLACERPLAPGQLQVVLVAEDADELLGEVLIAARCPHRSG